MGTDRSQVYEGPCPCGLGQIAIDSCTPDHPWPTKSHWFESKISCKACASKYAFEEQDNQYGLVDKQEIKAREKRYQAYKNFRADFLASHEVNEIINRLIILLDSQPSMAAAHRLLGSQKLVYETYSTFTKKWRGAEIWVNEHIALWPESVLKFSEIVGVKNEFILKSVSELKHLWAEYQRPLPFHGKALFDRRLYR